MNDEPTLPPHQPNTPRVLLTRTVAFAKAHWDYAGPVIGLALGWLIGKLL